MKYFLDTEFNEEVDPIEMISIGVVAEDGREFYAINSEYRTNSTRWETCHEWVRKNVKPHLVLSGYESRTLFGSKENIRDELRNFTSGVLNPSFWGYFADYDWFLVCRLFGNFEKMPKRWGNLCFDIRQYAHHAGIKRLPEKFEPEHNALIDARWTKHAFEYINNHAQGMKWP